MGKFITPKRLETFWATAVNKLTEGINGKKLSSNDLTDELKEKYDKAESNKIDSISVNGEKQTIDTDKNVNIEFDAGTGIQDITQEEYDALSEEEKMRDTIFHITDAEDDNVIVNVMLGETGETAYAGDKGKALADKIGDTDISAIGDGTCSGAINAVNENKLDKTETAASASKLSNTSAIGSATKPVYFNANGVPVAGTYELNKTVPSDAKFTDTVYTHPTSSGNKHIPSGGSSGKLLRWNSDGTAEWSGATNGSATQPIYMNAGVPTACTYTLGKSVPSNAVFTDTTYSNATTSVAGLMSANDKKKIDNSLWIDLKGDAAKTTSFPLVNIATGIYLVAFSNLYEDAGLYSFGVLFYYNNGYAGYNQITERHSTGSAYSISVNNGVVTSNRDIQNAKAIKIGYVNV